MTFKNKNMATIKVAIRKSNQNKQGKAPIRIRLRHKNQVKEITLPGSRIHPKDWDADKEVVKGNKMLSIRIENKVMKYKTAINQFEARGVEYNLEDIINSVNGNVKSNAVSKFNTVTDYIQSAFLNDMTIAYGTRKNYKSLELLLQRFRKKLTVGEINGAVLKDLDSFMKKEGYSNWTIHCRQKCLKRVANKAYENDLIEKPDWRGFKLRKGTSQKKFLNKEELELMLNYIPIKLLDKEILKAFLFSCFGGGQRFGDLSTLTYENLSLDQAGNVILSYTMLKTKNSISTALNKKAIMQIDKSKIGTKEMVFHLLPYQLLKEDDDTLKKAIESKNAYSNKRLKEICKAVGLNRTFSFHAARHTFICIAIQLGVPYLALKELAGFSNLKVLTEVYAKVVDETKNDAMKLFDKL